MPQRIQRKRAKGWRMPEGAVYVGRPTKWGNPYSVNGEGLSWQSAAVDAFRLENYRRPISDFAELRGKRLVCWCRLDQPCHADVLLELANA
jgi:hypothetical protein